MSSTATTPAQDLNAVMASCYTAHPEIEGGRLRAHKIEVHVTLRTIIVRFPDRPGCKIHDGWRHRPIVFRARGTWPRSHARRRLLRPPRPSPSTRRIFPRRARPSKVTRRASQTTPISQTNAAHSTPSSSSAPFTTSWPQTSALRDAWDFVRPDGGVLFCAWVSRYARYRGLALEEPARLARKPEFYARHAQDGVYVKLAPGGEVLHHELPDNMPGV
ncbi:hypothetical protein BD309DRAFT_657918 [Dichomitus squalens]|nr:hypothetical protein BD309DRAFT_657918 [Dichomitus squalens]